MSHRRRSPVISPPDPAQREASREHGLLERGRRSMDAFDYLEARHAFLEAFRLRGSPSAARALLDLLVGTMAAYDEALELAPKLPPAVRADQGVRLLLAQAAAGVDDAARALEWLGSRTHPDARPVLLTLAASALGRQAPDQARALLIEARKLGGVCPELLRLEAQLAGATAHERQPLREALEAAFARGDAPEAVRLARAMLARWPGDTDASRVLREIETHERQQRLQAMIDDAGAAAEAGRFSLAMRRLDQALEAGADPDRVAARRLAVSIQARHHREQTQVDAVLRLLDQQTPTEGWRAWLGLEPHLRQRVRDQGQRIELEWLEALAGGHQEPRAAEAALGAVAALHLALSLDLERHAERILEVLTAHERQLRRLPIARERLEAARTARDAAVRRLDLERIEAAEEAREARDWKRLELLLQGLPAGKVNGSSDLTERVGRLRSAVQDYRELDALVRSNARFWNEGRLSEAHALTLRLAEHADEAAASELREKAEEGWRQVQASLRITGLCGDAAQRLGELPAVLEMDRLTPQSCVLSGRGTFVHAASYGGWLFLREYDIDTGHLVRAASMRSWETLTSLTLLEQDDTLWIVRLEGGVIQLSLADWSVLRHQPGLPGLPPNEMVDEVHGIYGRRYLWCRVLGRRQPFALWIIDLETWRLIRQLEGVRLARVEESDPDGRILCMTRDGQLEWRDAAGERLGSQVLPSSDSPMLGIARHPAGTGSLVLRYRDCDLMRDEVRWSELAPGRDIARSHVLPEAQARIGISVVTSPVRACTWLLFSDIAGRAHLAALEDDGEEVYETERSAVDMWTLLLPTDHDPVLVTPRQGRVSFERLRPPRSAPAEEAGEVFLPYAWARGECACAWQRLKHSAMHETVELLGRASPGQKRRMVQGLLKSSAPDELFLAYHALDPAQDMALRKEILIWALENHPDSNDVLYHRLVRSAAKQEWKEALWLSSRITPSARLVGDMGHVFHLHALALAHLGQFDAALKAIERGQATGMGHFCWLSQYRTLWEPLEPVGDAWSPGPPPLHQLRHAVRMADQLLEAGAYASALELLDRPLVWSLNEVQSLARLAEAFLEVEAEDETFRYRKHLALALFGQRHEYVAPANRRELLFREGQRSRAQLDALAERAKRWCGGPVASSLENAGEHDATREAERYAG